MKKLIVIDVVGLTKKHFEKVPLPNISKIFEDKFNVGMVPSFPAVTCSVQASMTSGHYPSEHGIISNGFYDRSSKQVSFWEQSESLVAKPRIWDVLKKNKPELKTAVLFFQNSLYINSDIVITPKPIHLENQLVMWCYSKPVKYYEEIVETLGEFDLGSYWGPFASVKSSQWIASAAQYTIEKQRPDLIMVYLPHMDYAAQKNGPQSEEFRQSMIQVDQIVGGLMSFLESSNLRNQYEIMLTSEYSFNQVNHCLSPNIILRENGLLATRKIGCKEYVDYEYSKAFAMVDHQVAHVFIKSGHEEKVMSVFKHEEGIAEVLDKKEQGKMNIKHPKSGELILCAKSNFWFNYYWWNDIKYAPPFTFNVDIHRKPGFDPLELFLDPKTKKISHDTSLVKGSHGLVDTHNIDSLPVFASSIKPKQKSDVINVTQIAPTISKFFKVNYDFPNKPIL